MTKNALVSTSAVDALIGGFRAHLLGRPLPAPVAVTLHPTTAEVAVLPGGGLDVALHLGNILLWAYTLAETTAEWSHTDSGRLHISVHGRTTNGTHIQVYGGCELTDCHGLISLKVGESEGMSLDELFALVNLLREARREAA